MADEIDLAGLLTIWPIAQSFASHTPVGDLITLGRTSSPLRSSLHGRIPQSDQPRRPSVSRHQYQRLDPEVGQHQTTHWAQLKRIAPFLCSSNTHTRGARTKPCVYCSKPICDACIVRDSFKHRNENTFKNRLRYFCKDCWSEGKPTRSFRYPLVYIGDDVTMPESHVDGGDEEKPYFEANDFCECNLKDNGWLCLGCKEKQNTSSLAQSKLFLDPDPHARQLQCYGLGCGNIIDLALPDKDRRRVCLWCQRPLRRQWGGEDRFAWNMKTIEARARNAENRTRDLEEYNRQRLQLMRMSRRDMRGTSNPGDYDPTLLRHLDTINYRNWMDQSNVPDPEAVYKSKNGYWRYQPGFLFAIQKRCRRVIFSNIGGTNIDDLAAWTLEGGLTYARLNRAVHPDPEWKGPGYRPLPESGHAERMTTYKVEELKAHILEMHLVQIKTQEEIVQILNDQYGVRVSFYLLESRLSKWLDHGRPQSRQGDVRNVGGEDLMASLTAANGESRVDDDTDDEDDDDDSDEETLQQHAGIDAAAMLQVALEVQQPDVAGDELLAAFLQTSLEAATVETQGSDDPPPYIP